MSDGISNEQLMEVLFEIKGDVGKMMSKVDGASDGLARHIEDDKGMASDIRNLQMSQAKGRGALAVLAAGGSMFGAVIGWLVHRP